MADQGDAMLRDLKKKIFTFVFTKVIPVVSPLFIGLIIVSLITDKVNSVVLIIGFSVVSLALWGWFFTLGKKAFNPHAKMLYRFVRRIFFGAAAGHALVAAQLLGWVEKAQ